MRRTFKVSNVEARQLHEVTASVFRFRDWAVHPPADFRQPLQHDLMDVAVEWRFVAFRSSNACSAAGAAALLIGRKCDVTSGDDSSTGGLVRESEGAQPHPVGARSVRIWSTGPRCRILLGHRA